MMADRNIVAKLQDQNSDRRRFLKRIRLEEVCLNNLLELGDFSLANFTNYYSELCFFSYLSTTV